MVPTVTQQLRALRRRFAETVLPALPSEEDFAQEQAQLMLATLDWLLDTHEHEYRYEVVENHEYRRLLSALDNLDGAEVSDSVRADIRSSLAEARLPHEHEGTSLAELAAQTRRFKEVALSAASVLLNTTHADAARALIARTARMQGTRELAYFRMTGFPAGNQELAAELGYQRRLSA